MAEARGPQTSDDLSRHLGTNPVVVRRTMASLKAAGLVTAERGKGGGWQLARPLAAITLADVYRALGAPALFAFGHRKEAPDCLVEQAVNARIESATGAAEALLLARFAEVTLADLQADFRDRYAALTHKAHSHDHT